MLLPDQISPLVLVVSREEVERGEPARVLEMLTSLVSSPESARQSFERVDIAFHGYDDDTRDLSEIDSVREFVLELDNQFPYWLFFLSKEGLGLQCLLFCLLPPYLSEHGRATILPQKIGELLTNRWVPAMNHICASVGFSETDVERLTDRAIEYISNGPIHGSKISA